LQYELSYQIYKENEMEKIALVVDDEPLIRMMISEYLNEFGFETFEAENGLKALDLYHEKCPNIVVLDLRMPVMDGFEFLEKADITANSSCDAVILTGQADEADTSRVKALGAKQCFMKPFDPDALIEAVEELLSAQGRSFPV